MTLSNKVHIVGSWHSCHDHCWCPECEWPRLAPWMKDMDVNGVGDEVKHYGCQDHPHGARVLGTGWKDATKRLKVHQAYSRQRGRNDRHALKWYAMIWDDIEMIHSSIAQHKATHSPGHTHSTRNPQQLRSILVVGRLVGQGTVVAHLQSKVAIAVCQACVKCELKILILYNFVFTTKAVGASIQNLSKLLCIFLPDVSLNIEDGSGLNLIWSYQCSAGELTGSVTFLPHSIFLTTQVGWLMWRTTFNMRPPKEIICKGTNPLPSSWWKNKAAMAQGMVFQPYGRLTLCNTLWSSGLASCYLDHHDHLRFSDCSGTTPSSVLRHAINKTKNGNLILTSKCQRLVWRTGLL